MEYVKLFIMTNISNYFHIIKNDQSRQWRRTDTIFTIQVTQLAWSRDHYTPFYTKRLRLKRLENKFLNSKYKNFYPAHLREANRFYGSILMKELLPQVFKQILAQVENLRSNNSKEALTLASEILEHQNIEKIDQSVISPFVSALFIKTAS